MLRRSSVWTKSATTRKLKISTDLVRCNFKTIKLPLNQKDLTTEGMTDNLTCTNTSNQDFIIEDYKLRGYRGMLRLVLVVCDFNQTV